MTVMMMMMTQDSPFHRAHIVHPAAASFLSIQGLDYTYRVRGGHREKKKKKKRRKKNVGAKPQHVSYSSFCSRKLSG